MFVDPDRIQRQHGGSSCETSAAGASALAMIDLKKELKQIHQASVKDIVQLEVPALNHLMVDGEGDPNSSMQYAQAVEALFSVAYAAKSMAKRGPPAIDHAVMPLEGLWWADDMSAFARNDRSRWKWTMMIMQPPFDANEVLSSAIQAVRIKKAIPAMRARACRCTRNLAPLAKK